MKIFAKLTGFTLVALLATAAYAADGSASKLSLHLTEAASIAGTKLAPGDYNVFVTRDGDQAKVRVTSGHHEFVNTTAKYRAMDKFPGGLAVAQNSSHEVVELQSRKLRGALVFGSAGTGYSTADGSSK